MQGCTCFAFGTRTTCLVKTNNDEANWPSCVKVCAVSLKNAGIAGSSTKHCICLSSHMPILFFVPIHPTDVFFPPFFCMAALKNACHENNTARDFASQTWNKYAAAPLLLSQLESVLCVNKHSQPPLVNLADPGPRRRRISTCLSQNMTQAHGCLTGIRGHVCKIWLQN